MLCPYEKMEHKVSTFFKPQKTFIQIHAFCVLKILCKIQKEKILCEPYIKLKRKIKKAIERGETGNKVLQTTTKKVKE